MWMGLKVGSCVDLAVDISENVASADIEGEGTSSVDKAVVEIVVAVVDILITETGDAVKPSSSVDDETTGILVRDISGEIRSH